MEADHQMTVALGATRLRVVCNDSDLLGRLRGARAISQILRGLKQYVEVGDGEPNPTVPGSIPVAA